MRLKRVHEPIRSTAGEASARRARWWPMIAASTALAFALGSAGYVLTAVAIGGSAGAQLASNSSRALTSLGNGVVGPALRPYLNPKLIKEVPVGPGKVSGPVLKVLTSATLTSALDADGIPVVALEAYKHAAAVLAGSDPACHLPWQLLAAIGRVESDNGQFGGAMLLPNGNTTIPIYGIPLDGRDGVALVRDANGGYAQAEGPMQFLPSTWAVYGADATGNGVKDINNIFDAALGAADFLCADGGNMSNPAQEAAAVLRYNDADEYVHVVLALAASYEQGDFAAVPTSGPTPGTPPSDHPKTPAPTRTPAPTKTRNPTRTPAPTTTPTPHPVRTPAPQPTVSSVPTVSPAPTPTGSPTPTAPATPEPTGTTGPQPTPSSQPSQAPGSSATQPFRTGQIVDVGWAPAMRQVVVKLLATPKAPSRPVRPTHRKSRTAEASIQPARKATAPNHG
jgi:hypothetical protein